MMDDIIIAINQKLKTIHSHVYFEKAPTKKQFPYIIFTIQGSNRVNRFIENFILSLNFWDNKTDTEELDNIVDAVTKELNNLHIKSADWGAIFTKTSHQFIPDPDPNIRRREVLYRLKIYEGGE